MNTQHTLFHATAGALLLCFCAAGAFAAALQSTKAELFGVVRDQTGLPIPDAEVRLVNAGTEVELKTSTAGDGTYHFLALPPGDYRITVAKPGFSALKREGIGLTVGARVSTDL